MELYDMSGDDFSLHSNCSSAEQTRFDKVARCCAHTHTSACVKGISNVFIVPRTKTFVLVDIVDSLSDMTSLSLSRAPL